METSSIFLFIVAIVASYLSFYVLKGKRDFSTICFAFLILSISIWSYGLAFFSITSDASAALAFTKVYYIAAAGIPLFFWLFTMSFPKDRAVSRIYQIGMFAIFGVLSGAIILKEGFIIKSVLMTYPKGAVINHEGYGIYAIYIIGFLVAAYINLVLSYFKNKGDKLASGQLRFMIIGTVIPYVFGVYFTLILPVFTYVYIWIGPLFGLAMVMIVLYAVFKQHLFDTKIITAEIFTFMLWLFILMRALIAEDPKEQIANFLLLGLTILIGIFLIKSIREEIEARSKIELLAEDLDQVNQRLVVLDKQKSEFVSLASHQLRGPLAAIKGYSSMILEGDFGRENNETEDAVGKIYKSAEDLVSIVGDYLDVSRIEQGRMQYDFTFFDLAGALRSVAETYRPNIERVGLSFSLHIDETSTYRVNGDQGKIKQVIGNLIDNSIKYTPHGSINVWLMKKKTVLERSKPEPLPRVDSYGEAVERDGADASHASDHEDERNLIIISDSGIGIHPSVLPRLFEKFTRAPDASKTDITGTGLGLYVARKMIEAHHGKIWAESPGLGKGSTFYIELEGVK